MAVTYTIVAESLKGVPSFHVLVRRQRNYTTMRCSCNATERQLLCSFLISFLLCLSSSVSLYFPSVFFLTHRPYLFYDLSFYLGVGWFLTIPVAARSKAKVCGCIAAGIADSNLVEGMDVCLLSLYAVLSCVGRGLCAGLVTRPEESYCVSVCVWLRNFNTEEDKAQREL
jgi:hypothetical protein